MILAAVLGAAAGVVSGLLGVGGGVLFVPALTLALSLSQVKAEATSLLAIIPVALVGAARQHRYGNVSLSDGAVLGVLSAAGVAGGVALANALPQRTLRLVFAAFMLFVAAQFLRRFVRARASTTGDGDGAPDQRATEPGPGSTGPGPGPTGPGPGSTGPQNTGQGRGEGADASDTIAGHG
jgi:uncharacterized membrane protein YfcA